MSFALTLPTTLHHLIITRHVRSNEDHLGLKARPRVFEQLHRVRPSSTFLRVPEDHPLWGDVVVNQTRYRRSEGLLLIRAYPDEEPVLTLDARRKGRPDAGPRADAYSSLEH